MISTASNQESLLTRLWPALLIGGAWLWLFWPMITGQSVVGFRDSAYLYYPLFQWIDAQWAAGEIPLWNPYCNFGYPVVADGSSSVFYPGKLVFFCRFLSYPARYGIYIAVHIPIAAAGAYWFGRTLRANRAGATLAAFSYAFGGSVLFQVTNVIYLVSAAWLPFALCCVWKMVKTGEIKWSVAAGVCCALMILGGDPQMVYHVGLIAVATIAAEFLRLKRRGLRTNSEVKPRPYRWLTCATSRLILMILVTSSLAAIQILPTYIWSQHSERTNPKTPANLYMAAIAVEDQIAALIGPPVGTIDHSYQFSQPPWAIAELLWPNISGKPFPLHQRWTSSLPGAERIWVPSLYVGILVLFLALLGFRLWGRRRKNVWLTWLLVFFLLGSFGWYGAVWLYNEISPPENPGWLGPQVGGVYWAMNMLLPKYFAFRYPAKLFVIASLAISMLAATNLRTNRLGRLHFLVVGYLFTTTVALFVFQMGIGNQLTELAGDRLFGPFDSTGAIQSLHLSVFHSVVAALAIGFLLWPVFAKQPRKLSPSVPLLLVLITAADMLVANSWLVLTVDSSELESPTQAQSQLAELRTSAVDAAPISVFRSRRLELEPVDWELTSSSKRLDEIVRWQRESLYPKHHLGQNVVLIGSFSSIWPEDYEIYLDMFERANQSNANVVVERADDSSIVFRALESSSNQYTSIFWKSENGSGPLALGEIPISRKVIALENNRVVARVSTEAPNTLIFGRIADFGWKAIVRNVATEESKSVAWVDSPEPGLLFLPFEQPGEYEVEFVYSPIEFWVGLWISLFAWILMVGGSAFVSLRNRRLESHAKVC